MTDLATATIRELSDYAESLAGVDGNDEEIDGLREIIAELLERLGH